MTHITLTLPKARLKDVHRLTDDGQWVKDKTKGRTPSQAYYAWVEHKDDWASTPLRTVYHLHAPLIFAPDGSEALEKARDFAWGRDRLVNGTTHGFTVVSASTPTADPGV